MKISIDVEFESGDKRTVRILPVTQVAFEREHGCSITELSTQPRLEHLYWLAWHASKPGVDFDTWLESVAGLGDIEAGDPAPLAPEA